MASSSTDHTHAEDAKDQHSAEDAKDQHSATDAKDQHSATDAEDQHRATDAEDQHSAEEQIFKSMIMSRVVWLGTGPTLLTHPTPLMCKEGGSSPKRQHHQRRDL